MTHPMNLGVDPISKLFKKMFFPTLLGMVFSALFIITDGIFVGRGLGGEALAAVNIVSPIWLFAGGIGLMAGMGGSVLASLQLSERESRKACYTSSVALFIPTLFLIVLSLVVLAFSMPILHLLGSSDQLSTPARDYMMGFVPFMSMSALLNSGGFFVRLSGAPKFAMFCNILAAVLNVILDYLFIFVFKWGIFGAAVATSMGSIVGVALMFAYLLNKNNTIHFVRIDLGKRAFHAIKRICIIGFSSFLSELAVGSMMICGNYAFIRLGNESYVAAFSIACYFFPIVFMLYNSIAQSAQPLISFNFGLQQGKRVRQSFLISLKTALGFGFLLTLFTGLFHTQIVLMFVSMSDPTHAIASQGLPLFSVGFIFFAVNMVSIGYFQSVEDSALAMLITLLRGFIWMVVCFQVIPLFWGIKGAWLAVPCSEIMTMLCVFAVFVYRKVSGRSVAKISQ